MPMPIESEWLRANIYAAHTGVDRKTETIYGVVVAELGPFKSQGRGEFDAESLRMIAEQINLKPNGIKSRFAHPSLSGDGIGKFLGRKSKARVDGPRVRVDLKLDPTSHSTPSGDLGKYVMDLAESDPEAFGSSLVLQVDQKLRLDNEGRPARGPDGEDLPPLWYPRKIHASDVVDEGDAVHGGFLSAAGIDLGELPDGHLRLAAASLDDIFCGQPREVVQARCSAWLSRYLDARFPPVGQSIVMLKRKNRLRALDTVR